MGLTALLPGDPHRIGRYRLVGRLGAGGMGTVYLATGPGGADAAVKVIRPEVVGEPSVRARFAREAHALTSVRSPYTARVMESAPDGETPHLVTEYIPGPTLAEHVAAAGPLPPVLLHALATGLAAALTAIHRAGLAHRDLKPSNVILHETGPKIIDFGIALPDGATALTESGAFIGTPSYMAPEQVSGAAGRPADVFNWALTVAFAATGRPPFGTGTPAAVAYRVLHEAPDLAGMPPQARGIAEYALGKDPAARPTADRLLALLTGRGPEHAPADLLGRSWAYVSPLPPPVRPRPRRRPWRVVAPLAAAAAVVAIAVPVALLNRGHTPSGSGGGTTPPVRTGQARTDVRTYAPWDAQNLARGETASGSGSGSCWENSLAIERPDAYRCMVGNNIHDPCFSGGTQFEKVACPSADPFKPYVITLTKPLPTALSGGTPAEPTPWLLILADGESCTPYTGTSEMIGTQRANFGCRDGSVYGVLDRGGPLWTIGYKKDGTNAISSIGVATAWE